MKLRKSFGKFWREEVFDPSGIFWLENVGQKARVRLLEKEMMPTKQKIMGLHYKEVVTFHLEERP